MKMDLEKTLDSIKDTTKEIAETAQEKTQDFHETYVSKVIPDMGAFGDQAKFAAELIPGVAEYNAIREGDWTALAISTGMDVASVGIGLATAGMGNAITESGRLAASTETRTAIKELAEAGSESTSKKIAETIINQSVQEIVPDEIKQIDNIIPATIKTVNEELAGKRHPITGIEFVKKTVVDKNGEFVEGVFPKFDSVADVKLSPELFRESFFKQFKEANKQLWNQIESNHELKNSFTEEQLEQILDGISTGAAPDGFVWHHNEEAGLLQLVDQTVHILTGHTGGHAIWCID